MPDEITGEEVVRQVLELRFPMPKTRAWLRAQSMTRLRASGAAHASGG
jgi:hypothetical protein